MNLDPEEEDAFDKIKANLDNPVAMDENHPGWNNLIPKEKSRFKKHRDKEEDGEELTPD